jgi:heterodisulfide reductase subunit A-like polyferredoxin
LNPGLLERVNLRGEVAWAHQGNGKDATAKAKELLKMAVSGVRLSQPVRAKGAELSQRALVIGGGVAGMTSALQLAEMGHEVDLVERTDVLGGQLRGLPYALQEIREAEEQGNGLIWADPQPFLRQLIERVEDNDLIHIYRETEVEDVEGYVGNFEVQVSEQADEDDSSTTSSFTLNVGAIIVATGGHEVTTTEYLYSEDPRVVTQRDLEKMLVDWETGTLVDRGTNLPAQKAYQSTLQDVPDTVVMIQCVGSREPERPYCSRVCCTKAVTNALRIKEQSPETRVFVLYREMRTHGFREDYYREARERGVVFLRYELPDKPRVSAGDGGLTVRLSEPITGEDVALEAGLLVLSTGIESNDVQGLAQMLDVPVDKNGFFQEEYPKMRPLDFTKRGIFMCGLAHSPRFSDESIVQAQGAAMRAAALLKQQTLEPPVPAVLVNERLCSACGQCVEICPYGARVLEPGAHTAEVIDVLCQGCGACIVACPNKATRRQGVEMPSVYRMLESV